MRTRILILLAALLVLGCTAAAQLQRVHATSDVSRKIGVPVFPSATPRSDADPDHRSVVVNPLHGALVAESYVTHANLDEVLAFYSKHLGQFGSVQRCDAGRSDGAVFHINGNHFSRVSTCDGAEFGRGNVELKSGNDREQRLVIAERKGDRTEFTIIYVRIDGVTHEMI